MASGVAMMAVELYEEISQTTREKKIYFEME
jgi:hypothetical protein